MSGRSGINPDDPARCSRWLGDRVPIPVSRRNVVGDWALWPQCGRRSHELLAVHCDTLLQPLRSFSLRTLTSHSASFSVRGSGVERSWQVEFESALHAAVLVINVSVGCFLFSYLFLDPNGGAPPLDSSVTYLVLISLVRGSGYPPKHPVKLSFIYRKISCFVLSILILT